jgi:hypothetical protein
LNPSNPSRPPFRIICACLAAALLLAACAPAAVSPAAAVTTATLVASAAPKPTETAAATVPPAAPPAADAGIVWPETQILPSFGRFSALDVADLTQNVAADEMTLFAALQGLVNRAQPRIYLLYPAEEGPSAWLDEMSAVQLNPLAERWDLVARYRDEIKGIVIYDPAQPEAVNLATTAAGQLDGLPASPALAERLQAAPYDLPVLADLRGLSFESRAAAYRYAYEQWGAGANKHLTLGLDPGIAGNLRDYAVALRTLVVWLDPRIPAEEALLTQILAETPPGSPFVGYFPNPTNGGEAVIIRYLSQHAHPSFAMDVFQNATVLGGTPPASLVQTVPPAPALENKVYVTFFISDGDNLQYIQHRMRVLWDDPRRGAVPIGWTFQPAILDASPLMLDFYLSGASPLDVLVAGPSGLGYTYPNDWSDLDALARFAGQTQAYMDRAGMRIITLWDADSNDLDPAVEAVFAAGLPNLLGVTHQNWADFSVSPGGLAQIGLHPAYGGSEFDVTRAIAVAALAAGGADAQAPVFVAAQVNAWELTPTNLYNIMQALQAEHPEMVFVRPDHFFLLAREAGGNQKTYLSLIRGEN